MIIKSHDVTLSERFGDRKIELLPLCDDHLPLLYKWCADPEVLYWTEGGKDVELSYGKDTVHHIYGVTSRSGYCFLVRVNGIPIGECWLQRMNIQTVIDQYPGLDVRRIDMAIGEKQYWGKGIGTQFVGMLVDFAFNTEKVDLLHCFAEDYNIRSRKVWLKYGFRLVDKEELPQPQKGTYQLHFELRPEEHYKHYYSKNEIRFLDRLEQEIPYWMTALEELHGEDVCEGFREKLTRRFERLLPTLPYIGGDDNKMTLSLLDAARCLALYLELKSALTTKQIGEILFRAIILRQEDRGKQFYEDQTYTPEQVTQYRKEQAAASQRGNYPGDYVYHYEEAEGADYGYNFTECGAQKLFQNYDSLELLPYFCYLDYPKMLNTGLKLTRTQALSHGDSHCNHRFRHGEQSLVPWPPDRR